MKLMYAGITALILLFGCMMPGSGEELEAETQNASTIEPDSYWVVSPETAQYEEPRYTDVEGEYLFRYEKSRGEQMPHQADYIVHTEWGLFDKSGELASFELELNESFTWDTGREAYEITLLNLPPAYTLDDYVEVSIEGNDTYVEALLIPGEMVSTSNRIIIAKDVSYETVGENEKITLRINSDYPTYIDCSQIERYQKVTMFNTSYVVLEADENHLLLGVEDGFEFINQSSVPEWVSGERGIKQLDGKLSYLWCSGYSNGRHIAQISTLKDIINITDKDADFNWNYDVLNSISLPRSSPIFEKLSGIVG